MKKIVFSMFLFFSILFIPYQTYASDSDWRITDLSCDSLDDDGCIYLSWTACSANGHEWSVDDYGYALIYRSTKKSSGYKQIDSVDIFDESYYDYSVKNNKTYYYYIIADGTIFYADDEDNESYYDVLSTKSNIVHGKVIKTLDPPKLKGNVQGNSKYSIKLSWNKIKEAKGYKIYRKSPGSGKYKLIKTIKKNTTLSYTDKNLKLKKRYKYYIVSYNDYTTSKKSSVLSRKITANCIKYRVDKDLSNYDFYNIYLRPYKIYYKNKKITAEFYVFNKYSYKLKRFKSIQVNLYDENKKLIARQRFKNIELNLSGNNYKKVKFTFTKGTKKKKVNFRDFDGYYSWSSSNSWE
ncbi:MAG: fibronectin type III domain-containing protein [Lachnospiraceae bacterium]|nr:fibronectin type III domain-containing protein [Lachnospiraceae bacterium]